MAVALRGNALLTIEHGDYSLTALLPAIVGMVFGQRIRQSISEQLFRKVFFVSLLALGAYIISSAFGGYEW